MKTIFDKINPEYLECTAGSCQHVIHSLNPVIILTLITLVVLGSRLYKISER